MMIMMITDLVNESLGLLPLLLHDLLHSCFFQLLKRSIKELFPTSLTADLLLKDRSYVLSNLHAGSM
jgi:hypothetical protein